MAASGCTSPFEFAYEMLSKQERDPKTFFHAKLDTGARDRCAA